MSEKTTGYYEAIKKRCAEKRKSEPEPKCVSGGGALTPMAIASKPILAENRQLGRNLTKTQVLSEAVRIWHRFSWADVIRVAEALGGYEQLILGLEKNQRQGVVDAANAFRKEFGLKSDDMHDMRIVSCAGTIGIGFENDAGIEHTEEREVGMKHWCPMVQGIRDMGYENSPLIKDFHLWCDLYDNFEIAATNTKMCYTHTHCLARREDSYCRYCVDFRDRRPDENYYQWLVRMRAEKRAEANEEAHGDVAALDRPGFAACNVLDNTWGKKPIEEVLELGVRIQRRIAVATVITGVELLGWDKFIDGMMDKEIPRMRELMRNFGQEWDITGTTAVEAAVLMSIGMQGSGFDNHQFIRWNKKRAEGIGTSCPLVESAIESGLEGKLENMCHWCSAWHEANAAAMNGDIKVTFTHCIGKGDKLCRWIVE
jgi:hypothetical protein